MSKALISLSAKILVMFLMVNGVAHGDTGTVWSTMSRLQKHSYVTGYLQGKIDTEIEIASNLTDELLRSTVIGLPKKCDSKCMDTISEFAESESKMIIRNKKKFGNADVEQVVDGLDKFYADYRNRNILPADLIEIVIDGINGVSDESIEKRLEFFRKAASKN